MPAVKINARDIIVEAIAADGTTPLRVENLANVVRNPGENEEVADTTDFESEGAYEQDVMQRGSSLTLEAQDKRDKLTAAPMPGRGRIEEMGGEAAVGYDSRGKIRFRYKNSPRWSIWDCTVTLGEVGGGPNDKVTWSATITKCGLTTFADVA